MKGLSLFLILLLMSCNSQFLSEKKSVEFEDIYHHLITLTPNKYLVIDSQPIMNQVYTSIGKGYGGKRMPPIPQVSEDATFLIFKPDLKNSNDVQIESIQFQDQTLYIEVTPFSNPDFQKDTRFPPNIIIKLAQKLNIKKIIINTQN